MATTPKSYAEVSGSHDHRSKQSRSLAPFGPGSYRKSDAIFLQFGPSWTGFELLHEAAECFLKAYLIHHGWELVKTHDLGRLLAQACRFDPILSQFSETAQSLTEQFWEQHYPGGDLDEVGQDYSILRESLGEMIGIIESALAP